MTAIGILTRSMAAVLLATLLALVPPPATAQMEIQKALRVFFFGNSLIHHLSESDETSVPHWLFHLAQAGGHGFAADGVFGFPADFVRNLPPEANWVFDDVPRAWDPPNHAFRRIGFDTIILNPPNFIQHQPPGTEIDGASITALTARLFDWTANQTGARFFIYEGWSDLGDFGPWPPNASGMERFHAHNRGPFHDWHRDYLAQVRALRPADDIRLIPVASTIARVLTETPLSGIGVAELYSDLSPHGTANIYLLAAMVTYAALFNEAPPAIDLPDTIHPLIHDHFAQVSALIWANVFGVAPIEAGADEATGPAMLSPPGEPVPNPSLGMGLFEIADWSQQHPFIDMMKTARPWTGHTATEWGAWDHDRLMAEGYLTLEGWPLAVPQALDRIEAFVLTDQDPGAGWLRGRYVMTYAGRGSIAITGNARDIRSAPGEIRFSYSPGEGLVAISIRAVDAEDPIRDIRLMREDLVERDRAGEVFNPHWLRLVRDLRAVRFMDWMQTNHSSQVTWDNRPRPEDYTWSWRGVPVEIMVELANRIGADPWFTLPHMADDDYVRRFAEHVHDDLDPRLIAHVEWSNEVWNFIFGQAHWAMDQAHALWGADDPGDAWMQFAGLRAAQVADIWTDVFGPEADTRLLRIIAVQTGWPGLEQALLLAPLSQAMGNPPPVESFDAYAVTGYFGFELGNEDFSPTLRRWIEDGTAIANATETVRSGSLADLTGRLFPYHADVAAGHGLKLVMYEGGTHVVGLGSVTEDAELTEFFIDFNYTPEMAGLYAELLAGWDAAGGTLFNAFLDVARPSRWGSWGHLRHLDDMTPRWATLMAWNARAPTWAEDRAPGTFTPWLGD
ncbi:MAG: calcium-binding protein [Rubellimicrobium sp.]|nr:calcium-binding protein [Rubellimicrobium sp.]